jgi:hypothetical protein
VKPGDLRRFLDGAFVRRDRYFNSKIFLVLSVEDGGVDILIDGEMYEDWAYNVLQDNSEPVNETR